MANPAPDCIARFYLKTIPNKRLSVAEGRPMFNEREQVEIRYPGDRNRIHHAPANEMVSRNQDGDEITWRDIYPEQYKAFKANEEYIGDGTPVSELTFLTESKRAELRALNIHTAESLAALDGSALAKLGMGGRGLKDQAQNYIDKAAGTAIEGKFAAENAELREMIANLQKQLDGQPVAETVTNESQFSDWEDADIKAWIKDVAGKAPAGNPSHETLVARADQLMAKEQEAA